MESEFQAVKEGNAGYLKTHLNQINLTQFYDHKTLLHLACEEGFLSIVKIIVSSLKSYKLTDYIDAKDLVSSRTPLMLAMLNADDGNPAIVQYLIANKANVRSEDAYGSTPLHYAAENGQDQNLHILLEKNIDLDAVNQEGLTPLHLALREKQFNAFRLLIERGADLKILDQQGGSLLHFAIQNGVSGPQYLNILIESIDKSLKDRNGKTAYDYAVERGMKRVLGLLGKEVHKSSLRNYYMIGVVVMIAGLLYLF